MFKFSILSAFRRRLVAFLAIVGVGLGSGLLVALLSLSAGIESRFSNTFQEVAGTISVTAEGGTVVGQLLGTVGDPLPESYLARIKKIEGVGLAAPFVTAQVRSEKFGAIGAFGVGITGIIEGEELFEDPNNRIKEGRSFSGGNEVIAGARLLESARFADVDINVGDTFTAPIGSTRELIELRLVGTYETGSETTNYGLFGPVALTRQLADIDEDQISGVQIRAADPQAVNEVAERIEAAFADDDPPVSASVPQNLFASLSSFTDIFNVFLLAIALIAAAAGGTAVMVVMLLTVFERRREFGILKAGGWSNSNIIGSVLITSLTLALLGSAIGILGGSGVVLVIQKVLEGVTGRGLVAFSPEMFLWAGGIGIITGLIGGILPALSAARVSPIETLRSE
jgi:putative ABC transport system permease protein